MSKFPLFFFLFGLFCSPVFAEKPRILYLGDSLSMGAFGRVLDSGMRNDGAEVYTVVAGGASPYYWLKAYQSLPCTIGFWEKTPTSERRVSYVRAVPKMEDMIEQFQPDLVVIQTGINLYATLRSRRRPKEENVLEIRTLIEQMCHSVAKTGAQSYWILPPHSHERRYSLELQRELASIMRGVIEDYSGMIFESSRVTRYVDPYPATDGIHFGPTEATDWAEKVRADLTVYIKEAIEGEPVAPAGDKEMSTNQRGEEVNPLADIASSTPSMIHSFPEKKMPAQSAPEAPKVKEQPAKTEPAEATGHVKVFDRLDLDLRLLEKSGIKDISKVDYENALGVFEYEVLKDRIGNYPYDKIRVAHGIVFRRRYTSAAKREIGSTIALRLVPISKYPTLRMWQTVDELRTNYEMPIYTPKLN